MVQFIWNWENKEKIIALFGQNPLKETPQPTNCQLKFNLLYLILRGVISNQPTAK